MFYVFQWIYPKGLAALYATSAIAYILAIVEAENNDIEESEND